MDFEAEEKIWRQGLVLVGVDEAGRGPLAGPVVAAALLIMPPLNSKIKMQNAKLRNPATQDDFESLLKLGITDSKKISPKKREKIYEILTNDERVSWAVGEASEREIDELNILQASLLAMKRAVDLLFEKNKKLAREEFYVFVDGREVIPNLAANQKSVIGGDAKIFSIAAASIIAKVTRDRLMLKYAEKYPQYQFEKHKGYGTKLHYEMIKKHGLSLIHRKSFNCA